MNLRLTLSLLIILFSPFFLSACNLQRGQYGLAEALFARLLGAIDAIVSPITLTYTGNPYSYYKDIPITTNTPAITGTVTSCAVNPALPEGLSIDNRSCAISGTPTVASAATSYTITASNTNARSADTTISITVISAAVSFSSTTGTTSEAGDQATFTVRLDYQPTGTVVIGLSSSNPTEGTVSPSSLTFDSSNWNINQTITVTGVNDNTFDSNTNFSIITATITGTDTFGYVGSDPVDLTITNNSRDYVIYNSLTTMTGNAGGISGADAHCAANKPGSISTSAVKAVIVDGINRIACTSSNCGTGGVSEHVDWVLQPNSTYWRSDKTTLVTTTNANGLLNINLTNSVGGASWSYYHTGIDRFNWTTEPNTCSGWTDGSTSYSTIGAGYDINDLSISGYGSDCSCCSALCVQMP